MLPAPAAHAAEAALQGVVQACLCMAAVAVVRRVAGGMRHTPRTMIACMISSVCLLPGNLAYLRAIHGLPLRGVPLACAVGGFGAIQCR
jgi:hypothetical protein